MGRFTAILGMTSRTSRSWRATRPRSSPEPFLPHELESAWAQAPRRVHVEVLYSTSHQHPIWAGAPCCKHVGGALQCTEHSFRAAILFLLLWTGWPSRSTFFSCSG